MAPTLALTARRQPYIFYSVVFGCVVALSLWAAIVRTVSALKGGAFAALLWLLIIVYLRSVRLTLRADAIVFRELWKHTTIPIGAVLSIEQKPGHGISPIWIVKRSDGQPETIIKVANFLSADLRRLASALVEANPKTRFKKITPSKDTVNERLAPGGNRCQAGQ